MKFGKKGMSEFFPPDTVLFWIMFGIVLGFVSVALVLIVSKSGAEKAKIYENLESLNLMQRFLKSPDCFIYNREGTVLYNTIDYEKFNEQRMNSCYSTTKNSFPAFRITLSSDEGGLFSSINTDNWNDNRNFEEKLKRNVMVFMQNKLQKGRMEIEIQNLR